MNNDMRGKEFARANLRECAKELVEWEETGILAQGKVRELAAILEHLYGKRDSIKLAKSFITDETLRSVANQNDS